MAKIRTACSVMAEVQRAYTKPENLTKDEADCLIYTLYESVIELHGMAERMEARLIEYHDFVEDIADKAGGLLSS